MKIFTDIFSRLRALYQARYEPENLRPLADMYWRAMLLLTLVSIAGVVLFGVWEFVTVVEDLAAVQGGNESKPPVVLNGTQLDAVLNAYDARQAQYKASTSTGVAIGDPSK